MAGFNRVIDPRTKDYVSDGKGQRLKTRDARTPLFHQFFGVLGQWPGDPSAGSKFKTLARAKNPIDSPLVIRDIVIALTKPLVDEGRITAPTFRQDRTPDRVSTEINVTDIQSGQSIDLVKLLPVSF